MIKCHKDTQVIWNHADFPGLKAEQATILRIAAKGELNKRLVFERLKHLAENIATKVMESNPEFDRSDVIDSICPTWVKELFAIEFLQDMGLHNDEYLALAKNYVRRTQENDDLEQMSEAA